jgi:non-ribosomal peptide synthetase component F
MCNRTLHQGILDVMVSSNVDNDRIAIVYVDDNSTRHCISYLDLYVKSTNVMNSINAIVESKRLQQEEIVVAVVMEKGWEQVVAVLSILRAGCAYLPIDAHLWPEQRIRQVLELSDTALVLCQSKLLTQSSYEWMQSLNTPVVDVNEASSISSVNTTTLPQQNDDVKSMSELAYLIYTSGSTGVPKGVCCHHIGAVNTIIDINERFNVCKNDRVLGLSSLSFD